MNYYLVQTKYFLIFIIMLSFTMSSIPFLKNSFDDISDAYTRSQLQRIQGEMLFMGQQDGDFKNSCYLGPISELIVETYKYTSNKMICRTNEPFNSEAVICSELRSGTYQCVDSQGTRCEKGYYPQYNYSCRDLN